MGKVGEIYRMPDAMKIIENTIGKNIIGFVNRMRTSHNLLRIVVGYNKA